MKVDGGRSESEQCLVCRDWIILEISNTDQAAVDARSAHKELQAVRDHLVAALAIRVAAVAIVARCIAVQAHAYANASLLKLIKKPFLEKGAVGLHPATYANASANGGPDYLECVQDRARSAKQRLAAVEDNADVRDAVRIY